MSVSVSNSHTGTRFTSEAPQLCGMPDTQGGVSMSSMGEEAHTNPEALKDILTIVGHEQPTQLR